MEEPGVDGAAAAPASVGAVVLRLDGPGAEALGLPSLAFLPAAIARRVALAAATIELGGAPPLLVGLAAIEGRVVTVIGVGALRPRGAVVLCERPGAEPIALAVDEVVTSGVLPLRGASVEVPGGRGLARELHLAALVARVEEAVWAPRVRGASSAPSPIGAAAPHTTRSR